MKKVCYLFPSFIFLLFSCGVYAQADLAIGQWKSHLPFNNGISVTQSNTHIYYGTEYAVLAIDKSERAIQRITTVEGLSRVGVNFIKYNRGSKVLLVAYNDGTIDLLDENKKVRTLINIPASNIVLGGKKIYNATMVNDSIAYLSANFGITSLNLRTGLFPSTIKTPVEVRDFQIYKGRMYASTPEGMYSFNPASGLNVNDFANWTEINSALGFPIDYGSKAMVTYNGKLYADVNDSLYVFDGVKASYLHHHSNFKIQFLSAEGKNLIAGYRCPGDCDGRVFMLDSEHKVRQAPAKCINRPRFAVEDEQEAIWYADAFNFYRVQVKGAQDCEWISVNGPYSININQIAVANNQVWIASGGLNLQFSALFRSDGFFSLVDGKWSVYNLWNQAALGEDPVFDFFSIQVDPKSGKVYSGAILDALVVFDPETKEIKVYRENNSTLQVAAGDPTRTRVAGIAFDKTGALWIANNHAPRPLSVLRPDGTWQSFDLPCTPSDGVLQIAVDNSGNKWITTDNSSMGLIVFDEGNAANMADVRCVVINTANSVLPTNEVNTVEVDRDGSVWVGTKSGAVVFQCNPLDHKCPGTRPFIEVDGFGANLLEDQDVRTIGVDGANRKWFGTGRGIFVMSPEGNKQIAHFNSSNSPLFDNNIVDIAFNHDTGEAFIGTQKGLVSYRAEATGSRDFHSNNVLVYPNPVRPDYEGPIAIKGLATDARVKITDIMGHLVYETESLGGQAIWNGLDYNGRKASSGVYLVFATSRNIDRPDVEVAKILIVR